MTSDFRITLFTWVPSVLRNEQLSQPGQRTCCLHC